MSSSRQTLSRKSARLLAVILLSTGGTMGLSAEALAADAAPISVIPTDPQGGFAQLVTRVKAAVVQIATVSAGPSESGGRAQQEMDIPDGPSADMLRRYFGQQ